MVAITPECPVLPRRLQSFWSRRLLVASVLLILPASAAFSLEREYAVKAAFLFHFTQFVEWPSEALPPPGEPIRVGVLLPNPFGNILEEILEDQQIENRPIEVVYVRNINQAARCQILFIPREAGAAGRRMITALEGRPILLVGETQAFVQRGGMISLVRQEERVAIWINRSQLRDAKLDASPRLLQLAQIVENSPDS